MDGVIGRSFATADRRCVHAIPAHAVMRASLVGIVAGCAIILGCGPSQPAPAEQTDSVSPAPATPAPVPPATPGLPAAPGAPSAPWSSAKLSRTEVPRVYLDVWRAAANRSRCALLAPSTLPAGVDAAVARSASFSGGWAVAYDLPQERSAFGVAGSGSDPRSPGLYDRWPHKITWADGSSVGYGPEAGSGPNWLAYLIIPEQKCLYNVWSRRGQAHLEQLLATLRFVSTT